MAVFLFLCDVDVIFKRGVVNTFLLGKVSLTTAKSSSTSNVYSSELYSKSGSQLQGHPDVRRAAVSLLSFLTLTLSKIIGGKWIST
jgi:hypothetical protein